MNRMKRIGYTSMLILLSFSLWTFSFLLSEISIAASTDFPNKEIKVIVNYAAGGGRDTLARGVGKTMEKYLNVPMVVLNKPGAGGMTGTTELYNSAPDGYTIGLGTSAEITGEIMEKVDYESRKFTYIGTAQHTADVYFVKADSPFQSLKDFKTFGKQIRYSTSTVFLCGCVGFMVIAEREGFPLKFITGYKSSAECGLGVIRGEVEITDIVPYVALQNTRAGIIRPILTIDHKRHELFPNAPTVGEVGYPELAMLALDYWFMGPPGIPKNRVKILEDALLKTMKDPEFLKWAKDAGVSPGTLDAEGTTKLASDLFDFLKKFKPNIEKYRTY